MGLVGCNLNCSRLDIVVYDVLCSSCKAEEDAMVDMGVTFGRAIARDLHSNRSAKSPYVFHARNTATPSLVRGHFDFRMVDPIVQVTSVLNSVAPEFSTQRAAVQETADHVSQCPMWPFTLSILGRVVGSCGFQDVPSSHDRPSELL